MNVTDQVLLGYFTSFPTLGRIKNTILFFDEKENRMTVGVSDDGKKVVILSKGCSQETFFTTNGIKRDHPWVWKDRNSMIWITNIDFGRYLTEVSSYLIELPLAAGIPPTPISTSVPCLLTP